MKRLATLLTLLLFTFLLTFCDSGTDPIEQGGSRDYVWEIDTIDPGPDYRTYGFNIWGAAPDDIWLVGSADTRLHTTWHYDGEEWSEVRLDGFVEGGGIWGTASDNIWMSTSNNSIWHYDGVKWKLFSEHKYKDRDRVILQSMHGISEREIYTVGFAVNFDGSEMTRLFMKYDGFKWAFVEIPELNESFAQVIVDGPTENVFITSERFSLENGYRHLYLFKNGILKELATCDNYMSFGTIGKKVYITIESSIYTYEKDNLVQFKDFSGTNFLSRLWGRNENDFFTVNKSANLGHCNGSDLVNLVKVNAGLNRGVIFEDDFFIHAKDYESPYRDLIIHGTIKK